MDQDQRIELQRDWAKVQGWAMPALIILLLLTALDTLVYYADQRDHSAKVLLNTLPTDYQRTVVSLIASAGHTCPRVCSFSTLDSAPGTSSILVKCGSRDDGVACLQTTSYNLSIAPAAEPSR